MIIYRNQQYLDMFNVINKIKYKHKIYKNINKNNKTKNIKILIITINNTTMLIQKNIRIFLLKQKFKKLWKIAEYYAKRKYHPNNIHKFISFDN